MAVRVARKHRMVGTSRMDKNDSRIKELDDEIRDSYSKGRGGDDGEEYWTPTKSTAGLENEQERLEAQNNNLLKHKWAAEERRERRLKEQAVQSYNVATKAKGNIGG